MKYDNDLSERNADCPDRCDPQRIEDYLADRATLQQQTDFEAHLSTCDECRRALQSQAAEPEVWENATRLLGPAEQADGGNADSAPEATCAERLGIAVLDSLAPTDDPEMLGRLGEYEISGVIGAGGMGAVLRGFDKSLRRVVAIKVMAPHLAGSGPARHRFQREARAAAAITHDNVIDIYSVADSNGLPYLVMPYARGPSLQKRLDQSGPLSATELVRIGRQIAWGLAAAHEQGLVHRDIKPANILLTEGIERLWITDFGVARAMDDASMTQTGLIAGTPQYMSPEQARGEFVDYRSDLFSLGSVLYVACTGRPPFRSEAAYGVLRRITDTDPRPIRDLNSEIPNWLCQIIGRLMNKHPADRYQSAKEVAELFEGCLAHLQQPTKFNLPASVSSSAADVIASSDRQQNEPTPKSAYRSSNRQKGLVAMLSLLLAGAVGVAAMQLTHPSDISGTWAGEQWKNVSLEPNAEAQGWYGGSFTGQDGQKGALHFEWSRIQRRYNGRWKIGKELSGAITLRSNQHGRIAGAISFDPESSSSPATPRLRDFAWRRSTAQGPSSEATEDPAASVGVSEIPILSPTNGVVTKILEGLRNGSQVTKGEVIAKLSPYSTGALEQQVITLEQEVAAAQGLREARERELEIAKESLETARRRVQEYERVQNQVGLAGLQDVESAEAKLIQIQNDIANAKAQVEHANSQLRISGKIHAKGLVSEQEFAQKRNSVHVSKAKLDKAGSALKECQATIKSKQTEAAAKLQEARAKTSDATLDLNDKLAAFAKHETTVLESSHQLERNETQLEHARDNLHQQRIGIHLVAPATGLIKDLLNHFDGTATVKSGDRICTIVVSEERGEGQSDPKASQ